MFHTMAPFHTECATDLRTICKTNSFDNECVKDLPESIEATKCLKDSQPITETPPRTIAPLPNYQLPSIINRNPL